VIKIIDKPKLLVTPFGMSFKEYLHGVTSQRCQLKGERIREQIEADCMWALSADETGDILYFVDQLQDPLGGFTKSEVLQQTGQKNPFPGWQVLVVDGKAEIDRQTISKGHDEQGNDNYKNVHDFHKEYQEKVYDGLTPEDWISLHMIAMESGIPFDQQNWCLLLNSFLKSTGQVPMSRWFKDIPQVIMNNVGPGTEYFNRGSRIARRVGLSR